MSKKSRSSERSVFPDVLYGLAGDRPFKRMFFLPFKALQISLLNFMVLYSHSFGQMSNEMVFDSMVVDFCQPRGKDLKKVNGFVTEGILSRLSGSFKGQDSLTIEVPRIEFKKVAGRNYQRSLEVDLLLDQKSGETKTLLFRDTIDRKALKEVRASKHSELRGEHPGIFKKYLLPGFALAGGVATIASLFYIRSR